MNAKHAIGWLTVLALATAGFGRAVTPRHWQYKTCLFGVMPCDLNTLGAQGWELVAVTPYTLNGMAGVQVFLKRETP
jgi:hypothetical protein